MVRRSWGVVFRGVREVVMEEIEVAEPGAGQALVRMTRSLVSAGTEISTLLGQSARVGWPARPGYSAVGVIEAVGPGGVGGGGAGSWARGGRGGRGGGPAGPGYAGGGGSGAVGGGVRGVSPGQRVLTRARHAGYALIDVEVGSVSVPGGDTRLRPP